MTKHENHANDARRTERIRVWGLAAGRGTTKDAAPGAFTWCEYESRAAIPTQDWRTIIAISRAR